MSLIVSVSGLRGTIGQTLNPLVAARYAAAFSAVTPAGPILLSRDGRHTGLPLADAIRATLCGLGRDVLDADIAATPTTGVLVREHSAAGGIQISASHNPIDYNGMKLFGPDGCVIDADAGNRVLQCFRDIEAKPDQIPWAEPSRLGKAERLAETIAEHLRMVAKLVDVPRIQEQRFKVLLDSNHGAGSILGIRLLEHLGCIVVRLGAVPDGHFAHAPEPTAENLQSIQTRVSDAGCVVGFCQDPDADRLALIDEEGRYIGEEYTVALTMDHVLETRKGPVVINCSTSRMTEDIARRHGLRCIRSKVGEAHVTAAMRRHQAVFGGEGNGGPIDPQVGYVRDSFVAMALVLDGLTKRQIPLSKWVKSIPAYSIHKTKVLIDPHRNLDEDFDRLEKAMADATADRLDGLRLEWDDAWLLVRSSNTEPIVRLVAEARTESRAMELCQQAAQTLTAE